MRSENMGEKEELAGLDQEAADACDMKTEAGVYSKGSRQQKEDPGRWESNWG